MTTFQFEPESTPYPYWLGPFSPARGTSTGFRFHYRKLGTWVNAPNSREFWVIKDSSAVRKLSNNILHHWNGGRILFLPNGLIIKPLQDYEVGKRVIVGRFNGPITLQKPNGQLFDMSVPGRITPGDMWPGPNTTGLECILKDNGALICIWQRPTNEGSEIEEVVIQGPDPQLRSAFQRARPGDSAGRVRVTANGHIITNREERGYWRPMYIGQISPKNWPHREIWIQRRK